MGFYDDIARSSRNAAIDKRYVLGNYPEASKASVPPCRQSRVVVEAAHTQNKITPVFYEVIRRGERLAAGDVIRSLSAGICVIFFQ
jgi:hypothetical protein